MRTLRFTIGAVALALAGTGIVTALVLGKPGPAPDDLLGPPPSSGPPSETGTPAPEPARNPGWQVIANPGAGLAHEIPGDWTVAAAPESLESSSGVRLDHLADFGTYACQGAEYGRAFTGSGTAPGSSTADAATELAAAIAADQYSDGTQTARVTTSRPTPVVRDGARGTLVRAEAEAASDAVADPCAGARGTVVVVALATRAGTSVFVVGADTLPGAQEPGPLVSEDQLRTIADSVRPSA